MYSSRKIKWEIFVVVITAVSVFLIVLDYGYDFSSKELIAFYGFDMVVVGILVFDFHRRMKESGDGFRFIVRHWYEIPAMLPVFVFDSLDQNVQIVAALRALRLVRLFRLVQLLSRTARIFSDTKYAYMLILSSGTVILGGLSMYVVESGNEQSNIQNIGDGIWWAMVTITTVGYGDKYPVTILGRVIASFVMVIGIALLGYFISTLGASLVESRLKRRRGEPSLAEATKTMIKTKIDKLEEMSQNDISYLQASIADLYNSLSTSSKKFPTCRACNNSCPEGSSFCNKCGLSLIRNK